MYIYWIPIYVHTKKFYILVTITSVYSEMVMFLLVRLYIGLVSVENIAPVQNIYVKPLIEVRIF